MEQSDDKFYYICKMCFLCLANNKTLITYKNRNDIIVKSLEILFYCFPNLKKRQLNVPIYMCVNCETDLALQYKLKTNGERNFNCYLNYMKTLKEVNKRRVKRHMNLQIPVNYCNQINSISKNTLVNQNEERNNVNEKVTTEKCESEDEYSNKSQNLIVKNVTNFITECQNSNSLLIAKSELNDAKNNQVHTIHIPYFYNDINNEFLLKTEVENDENTRIKNENQELEESLLNQDKNSCVFKGNSINNVLNGCDDSTSRITIKNRLENEQSEVTINQTMNNDELTVKEEHLEFQHNNNTNNYLLQKYTKYTNKNSNIVENSSENKQSNAISNKSVNNAELIIKQEQMVEVQQIENINNNLFDETKTSVNIINNCDTNNSNIVENRLEKENTVNNDELTIKQEQIDEVQQIENINNNLFDENKTSVDIINKCETNNLNIVENRLEKENTVHKDELTIKQEQIDEVQQIENINNNLFDENKTSVDIINNCETNKSNIVDNRLDKENSINNDELTIKQEQIDEVQKIQNINNTFFDENQTFADIINNRGTSNSKIIVESKLENEQYLNNNELTIKEEQLNESQYNQDINNCLCNKNEASFDNNDCKNSNSRNIVNKPQNVQFDRTINKTTNNDNLTIKEESLEQCQRNQDENNISKTSTDCGNSNSRIIKNESENEQSDRTINKTTNNDESLEEFLLNQDVNTIYKITTDSRIIVEKEQENKQFDSTINKITNNLIIKQESIEEFQRNQNVNNINKTFIDCNNSNSRIIDKNEPKYKQFDSTITKTVNNGKLTIKQEQLEAVYNEINVINDCENGNSNIIENRLEIEQTLTINKKKINNDIKKIKCKSNQSTNNCLFVEKTINSAVNECNDSNSLIFVKNTLDSRHSLGTNNKKLQNNELIVRKAELEKFKSMHDKNNYLSNDCANSNSRIIVKNEFENEQTISRSKDLLVKDKNIEEIKSNYNVNNCFLNKDTRNKVVKSKDDNSLIFYVKKRKTNMCKDKVKKHSKNDEIKMKKQRFDFSANKKTTNITNDCKNEQSFTSKSIKKEQLESSHNIDNYVDIATKTDNKNYCAMENDDSDDSYSLIIDEHVSENFKNDAKSKKGKWTCLLCFRKMYEKTKEKHLALHRKVGPLGCLSCKKTFPNKDALRSHTLQHKKDDVVKCDKCLKVFSKNNVLQRHIEQFHKELHQNENENMPFKCLICNRGYKKLALVLAHMRIHKDIGEFQCRLCAKMLNYHGSRLHLKFHASMKIKCQICLKHFRDEKSFKKHMKDVHFIESISESSSSTNYSDINTII